MPFPFLNGAGLLESNVARARKIYGDRIRMATSVREMEPQPELLAFDCFHPNKDGQKMLSDKSWFHTWWSNY